MNNSITTLPPELRFDKRSINDIAAYSVLFVIAAIGNLTVFITLICNRHRKSRVNLMIMHLSLADLMVTLINVPIEVGWRITVQWLAGNFACKFLNMLRAFGLYLSSLVLLCISLDRYFAVVHPLKVNDAQRRGKIMLSMAWATAAVCSIPQSVVFYEASHPQYRHFKQCVAFHFFKTPTQERSYNVFCLVVMYFLPLCIIIIVYLRILWEISQNSKSSKEDSSFSGREGRVRLRRSDVSNIERARSRTLKMTAIIVLAFIICWTPYVVMVMWYMFDKTGAENVQKTFQDALFIMAVSNSCVNPIVYGTYTLSVRKDVCRCFALFVHPLKCNEETMEDSIPGTEDLENTTFQVLTKRTSSLFLALSVVALFVHPLKGDEETMKDSIPGPEEVTEDLENTTFQQEPQLPNNTVDLSHEFENEDDVSEDEECSRISPKEIFHTELHHRLLAILDEMSHFVESVLDRIESALKILLPHVDKSPIGTMKAEELFPEIRDFMFGTMKDVYDLVRTSWRDLIRVYVDSRMDGERQLEALTKVRDAQLEGQQKLRVSLMELSVTLKAIIMNCVYAVKDTLHLPKTAQDDEAALRIANTVREVAPNFLGILMKKMMERRNDTEAFQKINTDILNPLTDAVGQMYDQLQILVESDDDYDLESYWLSMVKDSHTRLQDSPLLPSDFAFAFQNEEYLAELLVQIMVAF